MNPDDLLSDEQEFRRERLKAAVTEKFGGNETEFGRHLGYKDGAFVRQMLSGRRRITEKTVAKVQSLRGLRNWFEPSSPPEGAPLIRRPANAGALDQWVSQAIPEDDAQVVTWEVILSGAVLPQRFRLSVPDDALAPRTPKGTEFQFSTSARPIDGDVVIVQAATGRRYVRLYFAGAGEEWEARARDPAHSSLHSARDGLELLAAAIWRAGGQG